MDIKLITPSDTEWTTAKGLIQDVFCPCYDATLRTTPPEMMIAQNGAGQISAAVGLRTQQHGFFSTVYLPGDLGQTLSGIFGEPVAASQVIEAVSMAALKPCAAVPLMNAVIAEGRRRNMRWGLFTGTRKLRVLLQRAGLPIREICKADRLAVKHPEDWGSYYDTDPRVCAFTEDASAPVVLRPACAAGQDPTKIRKGAS